MVICWCHDSAFTKERERWVGAVFPIDAEVEVFMHKNRKMTYKIKIYASMWRTVLCTDLLVLSD